MSVRTPTDGIDENCFVLATLTANGQSIDRVPCKLFLPERTHQRPSITIKPSPNQMRLLERQFCVGLVALIPDASSPPDVSIEAPEVYLGNSVTRFWGPELSDSTIEGEPQHLHIVKRLNGLGPTKTHLRLWISPNEFLNTATTITRFYTGEVTIDMVKEPLRFQLGEKFSVSFENHYRTKQVKNEECLQWSNLVACAEVGMQADDLAAIRETCLEPLDDFLRLASLALRHRTACLGWDASNEYCVATYYRGNFSFPDVEKKTNSNDGLVPRDEAENFLRKAYSSFVENQDKQMLRTAIQAAIPDDSLTIESSFLRLFAGLETLVLDVRRTANKEYVLDGKKWRQLNRYLRKCIKESTNPVLDRNQRAAMYSRLGELNRVSLQDAFRTFQNKYEIGLHDLWPIFANGEEIGLADIRNHLIHGVPLRDRNIEAMSIAQEHLRFTLERSLSCVLGWHVSKTNVSAERLRDRSIATSRLGWAREKLRDTLRSTTEST